MLVEAYPVNGGNHQGQQQEQPGEIMDHIHAGDLVFECVESRAFHRATRTEHGNDESKADGYFSRGNAGDEQGEHLGIVHRDTGGARCAGECHQGHIGRGEHHLQAHEHHDDVLADEHTGQTDGEQDA